MTEKGIKTLHLVGTDPRHSPAYSMHNYIAASAGLPWTFQNTACPAFDDVLALAKSTDIAGLVVTMPYKQKIIDYLDETDVLVNAIGACNTVYFRTGSGGERLLCGSNTDWQGIIGALYDKSNELLRPNEQRPGSALIVGAGGASRAAVYALATQLHCPRIYVLNRNEEEVLDLLRDCQNMSDSLEIIHVKEESQVEKGQGKSPYYIVGCVPDVEPETGPEKEMVSILKSILSREQKGVVLDMCFKPRRTRILRSAEGLGWECVDGIQAIAYQVVDQWRHWVEPHWLRGLNEKDARQALVDAADKSPLLN